MGKVREGDYMFSGCTSLVGGKGTVYNESHHDQAYAHVDGGAENPGYFTAKTADGIVATTRSAGKAGGKRVYNTAGQPITQPTKGLHIVNGKKIIIK